MTTLHDLVLSELLTRVQTTRVSLAVLHASLEELIDCDRSPDELRRWRMRSGPLKKVCDEIIPVARIFRFFNLTDGSVTFPLDNKVPDCWWFRDDSKPIGIEVTVAQGRARHILARETEEKGIGRGYLALQDGATKTEAEAASDSERIMYTTEGARATMRSALLRCLHQKNDEKYKDMILVIETDMTPIRRADYESLVPEIAADAANTPFSAIFAIGKGENLMGLKLK